MDFNRLLEEAQSSQPTEPRDLFEQLPQKALGHGYLRDVQAQILTQWDGRRGDRDIVIKVNTGGGKTVDGLVILQSYLNESISPALYVAPDRFLVSQVINEASRLGIKVTNDIESAAYLSGEAIGIVTGAKLFNGKSVFSDSRPSASRIPIGAVVIDDAHAILATVHSQFSVSIVRANPTFTSLLGLFEEDLKFQSPDALLDVQEDVGGGLVQVPFWAIRAKVDALRSALRQYRPDSEADFSWDAIRDVLDCCRVVFTRNSLTIVPPCPPIQRITSFAEASRRIFLTATLANDSSLVTDFDIAPDAARTPIQPLTAGDIGERLILAPQEINPAITSDSVREAVYALSRTSNTLVIVPSNAAMERWKGMIDVEANAINIKETVDRMRSMHVGLVIMANKYDGIDLAQDACRILVIDGLPESFSGDERLESLMQNTTAGIDDRQVQRIEQGMGRAVRSNEDHCVVFLIGRRLAQLTADPRTLERFSPATQAQLKTSRSVASSFDSPPLSSIVATAEQALERDEGWILFAKRGLRNIKPAPATVDESSIAQRGAFDLAVHGDPSGASAILASVIEDLTDDRRAGYLLEQQARYIDRFDPSMAQSLLARARSKNPYVLKPLSGLTFRAIDTTGGQAQNVVSRLSHMYGTSAHMRVAVEGIIERLVFDLARTEEFEEAFLELGLFLGLGSQRPERELGSGPDNLWAISNGQYWVVEAKSGATSEFVSKRDAGQLGQSLQWFGNRYPPDQSAIPVMIHHSRKLYGDATAPSGMRILNERAIGELRNSVRSLSVGLANQGWNDVEVVHRLIAGHRLDSDGLRGLLVAPLGGTT